MLGLGPAIKEILGKLTEHVKRKKTVNFTSRSLQLYIQGVSPPTYLLFAFSAKNKSGKRQTFWRENTKSFASCFTTIFSIRILRREQKQLSLFQKGKPGRARFDVCQVLFPAWNYGTSSNNV